MIMFAIVLRINRQGLLVRDEATGQEVQVNMNNGNRFAVGDRVRITFNGQMTSSIPPQISAIAIQRVISGGTEPFPPATTSSELRSTVIQRGRNFLLVIDNRGQQFRVEYNYAHHFCVGQQIIVRYDTITFDNPQRITATDIIPVC